MKFFSAGNQSPAVETFCHFLQSSEEEDLNSIEPIFHPDKEQLVNELIPKIGSYVHVSLSFRCESI